jgi:hypothetical protein
VKRFAVIGLVCFTGAAAHAQPAPAQAQGPALSGPAAATAGSCQLVSKAGDQYVESPLVGFEPQTTSKPLPVVQANSGAQMVLCNRSTIVPELTDYRVLTEMRLPLAIKSGAKTLFLGVKDGQVQFALPDGDATPDEMKALSARQTEMRTAMAGKSGAR